MIHENSVEFRVDFKSAARSTNCPIANKLTFLPYANLCKLDEYVVDMAFKDAGPNLPNMQRIALIVLFLREIA